MRHRLPALVLAGLLAAAPAGAQKTQPRSSSAPLTAAQASSAILAAEDSRLPLPDDLHTPQIDTLRAKQVEDRRLLLDLVRSKDPTVQAMAIRALGRLERRDAIPGLFQYLALGPTADAATAIAQAFRGAPLPNDKPGAQVQAVFDEMVHVGVVPADPRRWPGPVGPVARAVGRLPYVTAAQVQAADVFLLSAMRALDREPALRVALSDVILGVESLARLQGRVAMPGAETIDQLRAIVLNRRHEYPPRARVTAMQALIAARGVDAETLRLVVSVDRSPASVLMQLRRLAAVVLSGAAAPVVPTERTDMLVTLLSDPAPAVRIEAVRAWARQETPANGCQRLLDALKDPSVPVTLVAMDALGDQCKDDVNVTDRLTVDARPPGPNEWHLASHALVALAKRSPGRVFIPLLAGHVQHVTWQVRLYAARAAAVTGEVSALERLALDTNDNVREAALAPLQKLKGDETEPYFVGALGRTDYQLLRTTANLVKTAKPTPQLASALADGLARVSADKQDTSRDARLALLEALRVQGTPDQAGRLLLLLQDYDIPVAQQAAALIAQWTGKPQEIAPQLLPRPALPLDVEIKEADETPARIKMTSGATFEITLNPSAAPLMSTRFLRLAKAGYYNGLTFHRIEPNFVVQGGSPGANEYVGDALYVRDEISLLSNVRGTVGLSTRGRDTGDAQVYFNVVDNLRLDYLYTVFGTISGDVDAILEGDTIVSVTFEKKDPEKIR